MPELLESVLQLLSVGKCIAVTFSRVSAGVTRKCTVAVTFSRLSAGVTKEVYCSYFQ